MLTREELERYDRQIRLFGVEAQEKLKKSSVLVLGVGGLGTAASLYLTAAGVGRLIIVDSEVVELSNLNRQVLYWTSDVGRPKVEAAAEKLRALNPNVEVVPIKSAISEDLLERLVPQVDVVVDGLDNWKTRFLVNRVVVKHRKPFVHAGIQGLYGQLLVVVPGKTPCLQCILPREPEERRPFPVLGATPGILALMQVTEAIKLITGYGEPALGRLIVYDGYHMALHSVQVSRNPECPVCGRL